MRCSTLKINQMHSQSGKTMRSLTICTLLLSLAPRACESLLHPLDRRTFGIQTIATSSAAIASAWGSNISPATAASGTSSIANNIVKRLDEDILKQPPVSSTSELNGIDNTYFPAFMEGTWDLTQTLVGVSTPLGLMFAGGPNGLESIASKSMAESRERLNQPVTLQVRYVPTKWGIVEDRVFNTRQRLDAFAGRKVVASVDYADVGGSNRATVKAMGGTDEDPLQTTIVRFKGPAAQKAFVTGHKSDYLDSGDNDKTSWTGYEMQRSIFALTNESTAPPIFTDSEYIWKLDKIDDNHVKGKFRIVGYLNPNDKLYFEARNRGVSIQDYTLEMTRVK